MARSTIFRFKQFSVDHAGATMKVGTDGVLLGAWTDVSDKNRLLDIGTGSGLIALMLAQRSNPDSHIDAVEIGSTDAEQARSNVAASPWPEKITVHTTAIQDFNPINKYDCIISNPPFFINSYPPPDSNRTRVRHSERLSYEDLIHAALRLMTENGSFNVILPPIEGNMFVRVANDNGLFCSRIWSFLPREDNPVERLLLEFKRHKTICEESKIVHYGEGVEWSTGYKELTKEFYLKL